MERLRGEEDEDRPFHSEMKFETGSTMSRMKIPEGCDQGLLMKTGTRCAKEHRHEHAERCDASSTHGDWVRYNGLWLGSSGSGAVVVFGVKRGRERARHCVCRR